MAGAKLADLQMQEKKTKTVRKAAQEKDKYTRKTGKTAGESRKKKKPAQKKKKKAKTAGTRAGKTRKAGKKKKPKTKTANKSLSSQAM